MARTINLLYEKHKRKTVRLSNEYLKKLCLMSNELGQKNRPLVPALIPDFLPIFDMKYSIIVLLLSKKGG